MESIKQLQIANAKPEGEKIEELRNEVRYFSFHKISLRLLSFYIQQKRKSAEAFYGEEIFVSNKCYVY